MWSEQTSTMDDVHDASCIPICDHRPPAPFAFDRCHDWLAAAHRGVGMRFFRQPAVGPGANGVPAMPGSIVFVPRSQPERAHTVAARDFDEHAIVAAIARNEWFVQETAIDMQLGPTGHLQVRLRAEWVIGPPDIRCASLRPRHEPACIVAAIAEMPLEAEAPRIVSCVICYDDLRIAA